MKNPKAYEVDKILRECSRTRMTSSKKFTFMRAEDAGDDAKSSVCMLLHLGNLFLAVTTRN